MIYIIYIIFSLIYIYFTPLFKLLIPPAAHYIKKKPILLRIISISGDVLYMVGGGVIAGLIMQIGLSNFTIFIFFNNYGTIMVITGAIIREYFKNIH